MNLKSVTCIFFWTVCGFMTLSDAFGQYANQKEIINVVQADTSNRESLYKNAKQWVLSTFITSDNIVEFDDEGKETINVTGHLVMDKQKFMQGAMGYFVNTSDNALTFKLRLDFKEDRFRYVISNMQYSFYKHGAPQVAGRAQYPLDEIDMPKKKVKAVDEEADQKLTSLIQDMEANILKSSVSDDW